jgi:DNA ligase (NAD+)
MDIDGLGPETVQVLVDAGLVSDFADLYKLSVQDVARLPGFAEKSAQNLVQAIQESKNRGYPRLLASLGIRLLGHRNAGFLASKYRNIDKLLEATKQDLERVFKKSTGALTPKRILDWISADGKQQIKDMLDKGADMCDLRIPYGRPGHVRNIVGKIGAQQLKQYFNNNWSMFAKANDAQIRQALDINKEDPSRIAKSVYAWLQSDKGRDCIARLKEVAVLMEMKEAPSDSLFTVVITGELESMSRDEAEELVRREGGKAASSVSANTDYLVFGAKPGGTKMRAAEKHKTPILDENAFLKLVGRL